MQKALDNILQHYLRQETLVTDEDGRVDEELLQSLQKCLQEKGVLKEVHSFLRQRLVGVLQGTWPQLFDHFRTDGQLNTLVLKLVEDFLCSHKLLFTLSVLSTELGDTYSTKVDFRKLASAEAEDLLVRLGIEFDSIQSLKILENYGKQGNTSLFESIINSLPGIHFLGTQTEKKVKRHSDVNHHKNVLTLDERLQKIDEKYLNHEKKYTNEGSRVVGEVSVDQRFRKLALALERDKQIQLQIAIDNFKSEELSRLREEVETEQKFELLRKEKELLANYEEKVNHMKNNLEREKELWLIEKIQKEREIFERREELLLAIQSVRGDLETQPLQTVVERVEIEDTNGTNHSIPNPSVEVNMRSYHSPEKRIFEKTTEQKEMERAYLLKEAKLRTVIEKLEKENQALKTVSPLLPPPSLNLEQRSTQSYTSAEEFSLKEDSHHQRRHKVKNVDSLLSKQRPRVSPSAAKVTVETKWRSPDRKHHLRSEEYNRGSRHKKEEELPPRGSIADTDTIAFLQYQLEHQSEEIEKLRNVMQNECKVNNWSPRNETQFHALPKRSSQSNYKSPPPVPKYLETSDVDEFLREAKKRISDIEQEAQLVEKTLVRMNKKKKLSKSSNNFSLAEKTIPFSHPPVFQNSAFTPINSIPISEVDVIPNPMKSDVLVDTGKIFSAIPTKIIETSLFKSHASHLEIPSYPHQYSKFVEAPRSDIQPVVHRDNLTMLKTRDDQLKQRLRLSNEILNNDMSVSESSISINSDLRKSKRQMAIELKQIDGENFSWSSQDLPSKTRSSEHQGRGDEGPLQHPTHIDNEHRLDEVAKTIPPVSIDLSEIVSSVSLEEKASRSGALVKDKIEQTEINVRAEESESNISISSANTFSLTKPRMKSPESEIEHSPISPIPGERRPSAVFNSNPINVNFNSVQSKEIYTFSPFTPLALPITTTDLDDLGMLETSKDLDIPEKESFWNM